MSILSDHRVVQAIFKHSTSPRERDIARQVDNEEGRDKQRIISGNRAMWAYYERIAEEDDRKRGY